MEGKLYKINFKNVDKVFMEEESMTFYLLSDSIDLNKVFELEEVENEITEFFNKSSNNNSVILSKLVVINDKWTNEVTILDNMLGDGELCCALNLVVVK